MVDISTRTNSAIASVRNFAPSISAVPQAPTNTAEHVSLFDLPVVSEFQPQMVRWIAQRAMLDIPTRIAFLNAHCANVASTDWRYRSALASCDAILPDGIGIEIAARMVGKAFRDNLNGTDLFIPLCEELAEGEQSIFLLGGRPGIAEQVAANACEAVPTLKIAGFADGYFSPQDEDALIDQINASGAKVLFCALGVPSQDVWLARIAGRLDTPVVMGVGGLFDFVSGATRRAPKWVRDMRMEWAYRLAQEPRRMWRRYLVGNLAFVGRAVGEAWRRSTLRTRVSNGLKRGLDVLGASAALLALSPLMLVTAGLIRAESRGPALFRQTRVGENGETFTMLKFRSMSQDAEARLSELQSANDRNDGVTFKLRKDPRVTRVGEFIRKYSIDELPQFLNVLTGEMSLVGPRPALPSEVAKYGERDMRRLAGKPGITGLWQVSGRADIPFQEMVELDVQYLETRSIWTDISLLLRTPMAVLAGRGAY